MITIPEKLGLGWEEQVAFFADNSLGLENSAKSKSERNGPNSAYSVRVQEIKGKNQTKSHASFDNQKRIPGKKMFVGSVKSQTSRFHETYSEASGEMVRQGNERTTGSDGRRA
ncbi:unnamed protein product [Linum tenue]|uniref:Uncharacterized protein n=1 Tax=Linum tenue TaxID=586396 RepID=A0AAV0L7T5_9ROSI|nr:unnamed protein product [Linum tenue]